MKNQQHKVTDCLNYTHNKQKNYMQTTYCYIKPKYFIKSETLNLNNLKWIKNN
jgi:hypothetical protein